MRIGVIGAGAISAVYLEFLTQHEVVAVTAIADLVRGRADAQADAYGVPRVVSPDELMHLGDVDLVLNLTVPRAHAAVSEAALRAGKHVYSEKPLAVSLDDGYRLRDLARRAGLGLGCAPDTVLGSGIQTARAALDDGVIGEALGASLAFMNHGHEHWHPNPGFYYEPGGGPVLDMGPYYLTALVTLLGPVRRVVSRPSTTFPTRPIPNASMAASEIRVEVPTHVIGILEMDSGMSVQVAMSFDVWHHRLPHFEVYGTTGTMEVPDPNTFGGPVSVRLGSEESWRDVSLREDLPEGQARGIGLMDMVAAVSRGRTPRLGADLAVHVLEVLTALAEGGDTLMRSTVNRPDPM